MPELDPYEGFNLRRVPLPDVVAVGDWWRARWRLRPIGVTLKNFPVPPPWGDVDTTSMFISCWWDASGELVVDVFSRSETISGETLTCASMIAAWFEYKVGVDNIEVNGVRKHPVVRLSQMEAGYIEEMESLGY